MERSTPAEIRRTSASSASAWRSRRFAVGESLTVSPWDYQTAREGDYSYIAPRLPCQSGIAGCATALPFCLALRGAYRFAWARPICRRLYGRCITFRPVVITFGVQEVYGLLRMRRRTFHITLDVRAATYTHPAGDKQAGTLGTLSSPI